MLQSEDALEDPAVIRRLENQAGVKLKIDGVGEFLFPADTSEQEIKDFVKENYPMNVAAIPRLIEQMMEEKMARAVESARETNDRIHHANKRLVSYSYGAWFALTVSIYVLGWACGWVYRGFRGI